MTSANYTRKFPDKSAQTAQVATAAPAAAPKGITDIEPDAPPEAPVAAPVAVQPTPVAPVEQPEASAADAIEVPRPPRPKARPSGGQSSRREKEPEPAGWHRQAWDRWSKGVGKLSTIQLPWYGRVFAILLAILLWVQSIGYSSLGLGFKSAFLNLSLVAIGTFMEMCYHYRLGNPGFHAVCRVVVIISIGYNVAGIIQSEEFSLNMFDLVSWLQLIKIIISGTLISYLPELLVKLFHKGKLA